MRSNVDQPCYVKQYVSGILDYSSQYGSENPRSFSYSISNLVGEPKIFPKYGDYTQAAVMRTYGKWWNDETCGKKNQLNDKDTRPQSINFRSEDYIDLIFEQAVYPWSIAIYETYNPGGLVRILAMCEQFPDLPSTSENPDESTNEDSTNQDLHKKLIPMPPYGCSHWEILWESKPTDEYRRSSSGGSKEARMFAPILQEINHRTRIIRLEFCHQELDYYTEIDAVELTGTLHFYQSSSVDPPPVHLTADQSATSIVPGNADDAFSESKIDLEMQQVPVDGSKSDDVMIAEIDDDLAKTDIAADDTNVYGHFGYLPCEILTKIFEYLPISDLLQVAKVCRLFHAHSYDQRHLISLDLQPYWHLANQYLLDSIVARFPHPDNVAPPDSLHDKSIKHLNLSWLGGGDIITCQQLARFIANCNLALLRHLDMTSSPCVSDESLKLLVLHTPLLQHLNLQSCDKPTSEGIRVLGDLKMLHYLNLYRTQADDAGVICIIQNNKKLQNINLGSCMKIIDFDRIFEELGDNCTNMRVIDVWRAKTITSRGLHDLVQKCHYLEELDIGWCTGLTSNSGSFVNLAENCPNLRKLFLTANRTLCDNDIIKIADSCPKLQLLDILGTRLVSRATIEYLLTKCLNLKFLDLSFCYSFNSEIIDTLRSAYPQISIKRSFQD